MRAEKKEEEEKDGGNWNGISLSGRKSDFGLFFFSFSTVEWWKAIVVKAFVIFLIFLLAIETDSREKEESYTTECGWVK